MTATHTVVQNFVMSKAAAEVVLEADNINVAADVLALANKTITEERLLVERAARIVEVFHALKAKAVI